MNAQQWIFPALDAIRTAQPDVVAGRFGRLYSCVLVIAHSVFPVPENDMRVNLVIDEPLMVATRAPGRRR
jgi:hypothetical protein